MQSIALRGYRSQRAMVGLLAAVASVLPVAGAQVAGSPAGGSDAAGAPRVVVTAARALPQGVDFHPLPTLYTGGQPDAKDWTPIAESGVTTVIDLRPASEREGRDEADEVAAAGMAYVHIPIADAAQLTPQTADTLWNALQAAAGTTLLHCASGNRAGALLAIAVARKGGVAPEGALALGRAAGMRSTEARVREVLNVPPAAFRQEPIDD